MPLIADHNLITQSALYLLRCNGVHAFPAHTSVHIINPIPLGRGLGSSGAAVVAGILLGNVAGGFNLPKARLLDYCLMIERHPDNVAAALYGGFVGTYLRELEPEAMARKEIPLSEVLPAPAGGVDTGLRPPEAPVGIGHYIKFRWAPEVKAIAIIPDFEVKTAEARGVLPETYSRSHVVSSGSISLCAIRTNSYVDIQHAKNCVTYYSSWAITAGSRTHLRSHAGQSAPTLPQSLDTGSCRCTGPDVSAIASRPAWYLPVWSWTHNTGTGDKELRADCGGYHTDTFAV